MTAYSDPSRGELLPNPNDHAIDSLGRETFGLRRLWPSAIEGSIWMGDTRRPHTDGPIEYVTRKIHRRLTGHLRATAYIRATRDFNERYD